MYFVFSVIILNDWMKINGMTECAGDCVRIHVTDVCSNQEMWP